METVLITGGTGLVGTYLADLLLQKGYAVIIVSRQQQHSNNKNITYATWNPQQQTIDEAAITASSIIINLAGAGVADKRWSNKRKIEINESRINAGKTIVAALKKIPNNVHTVINASAIGWYGPDANGKPFTEDTHYYNDFLGTTCHAWEQSIAAVEALQKRLVVIRIGIVLSKKGGALVEFLKPLKAGIAAILGNGKQVISWIHIHDLCNMFIHAIENKEVRGIYNGVSANPISNKQLTLTLAKIMRGSFFIPLHVPAFLLQIILGEMSIEVLKSCTVSNHKIKQTGFSYRFNALEDALRKEVG